MLKARVERKNTNEIESVISYDNWIKAYTCFERKNGNESDLVLHIIKNYCMFFRLALFVLKKQIWKIKGCQDERVLVILLHGPKIEILMRNALVQVGRHLWSRG